MCNYRKERRAVDQRTFKIGSVLELWGWRAFVRMCVSAIYVYVCKGTFTIVACSVIVGEDEEGRIELGGYGRRVCNFSW